MHLSDIVRPYQARQNTRALHRHVVVKQLHLDIRTQNAIVSMANRIHAKFSPTEFRILRVRPKPSILSQICMFFYLRSHKGQHVVRQFQYWAGKDFILYHIHLCAHFGFGTLITYHAYLRPLEETLWVLTKQQHRRTAQRLVLLATIVLFLNQVPVFTDISLSTLTIANQSHILLHQRHIQVIPTRIVHRRILVVVFTFGIH